MSSSTGVQPSRAKRSFTARGRRLDLREHTRRTPGCPAATGRAARAYRPARAAPGAARGRSPNASKPRTMFFDGSTRSTRTMSCSGRHASSLRLAARARSDRRAQLARTRPGRRRSDARRRGSSRRRRARSASAHSRNSRRQRSVWKPTTSFASRPSWIAGRQLRRAAATTRPAPATGCGRSAS